MKAGAPPVGLWLRLTEADLIAPGLEADLRKIFWVINGSDWERNMHAVELDGAVMERFPDKAAAVLALAARNGMATLVRGDWRAAHTAGADGVLLTDITHAPAAREAFGTEGIVGLACGTAGEAAAAHDAHLDCVSVASFESLRFWVVLSDRPALVESPVTNDTVGFFVRAGATFLDGWTYISTHPKGVAQGTVNLLHAVDLALEQQSDTRE
ncbi:MAG TPA: hypothetical protein DDX54_03015 [Rhodospirillaceae bacterium]|jgi:hypothetical protein|nr:hypothetical protein [Rhodospirillaceae bacterium]